jgi:hypothetical protein
MAVMNIWALPFLSLELEFAPCSATVPRLGPPTSNPFVNTATDRRRFPRLETGEK